MPEKESPSQGKQKGVRLPAPPITDCVLTPHLYTKEKIIHRQNQTAFCRCKYNTYSGVCQQKIRKLLRIFTVASVPSRLNERIDHICTIVRQCLEPRRLIIHGVYPSLLICRASLARRSLSGLSRVLVDTSSEIFPKKLSSPTENTSISHSP